MQSDPTSSTWMSASCSHSDSPTCSLLYQMLVLQKQAGAISYRHNSIQASLTLKNPTETKQVLVCYIHLTQGAWIVSLVSADWTVHGP